MRHKISRAGVALACMLTCACQSITHQPLTVAGMKKAIDPILPTIGILIFDKFLTNEVVAPLDVFTKPDSTGKALFNVVLIAKEEKVYVSEVSVLPDYTIDNTPELHVLVA